MRLGCSVHHLVAAGLRFNALVGLCAELGITDLELGVANRLDTPGMSAEVLLTSARHRRQLISAVEGAGLQVAALNCFGNPLHPAADVAEREQLGVRRSIELAAAMGIKTVVSASGCPGVGATPVWITWPLYWDDLQAGQWSRAIDVWGPLGAQATSAGVEVAIKLHPGQIVYNVATFLKLADAVGPALVANIDPAHMFYQGMDPLHVLGVLSGRVGHVHAKDTVLNRQVIAANGFIDASPLDQPDRSWRFVAVGDGHDTAWWRTFLETLVSSGYSGMISIEHADSSLDPANALRRNVTALRRAGL